LVAGAPFDSTLPTHININGDFYAIASVTDSQHLVLVDSAGVLTGVSYYIQPTGVYFPGLVYDTVTKKMLQFGGTSPWDGDVNQTWAYDIPTKTWRQKAVGTAAPPVNATLGNVTNQPAIAYNTNTHKVLYHQFSNSGAPADWQYDPEADTWTQLTSSGSGATNQQYLAYDSACDCLIGWSQAVDGYGPDVWQGKLTGGATSGQ